MVKAMPSKNLPSDVIKQIIRGIQKVEQKMRRLGLLDPIEHGDGSIRTGNLGNILPMDLPDVVIRAHSSCMFPSDTRCWVSIIRSLLPTSGSGLYTFHH